MKLEQQVVSLELSKRLKELGVKQDSLWWWFKLNTGEFILDDLKKELRPINTKYIDKSKYQINGLYSAFTCAELSNLLPAYLENPEVITLTLDKSDEKWGVYFGDTKHRIHHYQESDTLANAMAKMLVYLLERN